MRSFRRLHTLCREKYETPFVPGSFFGAGDCFRIGIGVESDLLREGLERVARAARENG